MSTEITMPKLSDTMEEGKILQWLKRPGDTVHRGDTLAEVETDKADMLLEAFEDGVLQEILLNEGESAPVGSVIARLTQPGEEAVAAAVSPAPEAPAKAPETLEKKAPARKPPTTRKEAGAPAAVTSAISAEAAPEAGEVSQPAVYEPSPTEAHQAEEVEFHPAMSAHPSAQPTAMPTPPRQRERTREPVPAPRAPEDGGLQKFKASPLARRAAEEAGIDLSAVRGTGPEGRITKRDVENFLREQQLFRFRRLVAPREGVPGTFEELSAMRRTIAQRMAASKREIPHFYVTAEVDMDEAVRFKSSLEATELFEEDITFNDIVVKAAALALTRYTRLNSSYENGGIATHPHINIGIAVAVEDGLIVPVIHECERLTLPEIAHTARRLVAKASQGGFTSEELSGGTFSISNMGMLGIEHFAAVIIPPQSAILAISAIKDRPVVRNGQVVVGKTMMVTVSCDHRVIDGVVAGRFLQEIKRFLENPASLLI